MSDKPVKPLPAVVTQGLATRILGFPVKHWYGKEKITITEETKAGKKFSTTRLVRDGELVVKDIDGAEHKITLRNHYAFSVFKRLGLSRKDFNDTSKLTKEEQYKKTAALYKSALAEHGQKPLTFITNQGNVLVGTVSGRYCPTDIKQYETVLRESVLAVDPKAKISIIEGDGLHGGRAVVDFSKVTSLWQPQMFVNLGKLNGDCGLRVYGGATIFSCKNQLTTEARHIVDAYKLPIKAAVSEAMVHLQKTATDLPAAISAIVSGLDSISGLPERMQKIKFTVPDCEVLLAFYRGAGRISLRTSKLISIRFTEDEEKTLYGFMMAMTWVATHQQDLKDGVAGTCRRIGGEIVIVSQCWPEFFNMGAQSGALILKEEQAKLLEKEKSAAKMATSAATVA